MCLARFSTPGRLQPIHEHRNMHDTGGSSHGVLWGQTPPLLGHEWLEVLVELIVDLDDLVERFDNIADGVFRVVLERVPARKEDSEICSQLVSRLLKVPGVLRGLVDLPCGDDIGHLGDISLHGLHAGFAGCICRWKLAAGNVGAIAVDGRSALDRRRR